MHRVLDAKNGFTCQVTDTIHDIDIYALQVLGNEAWSASSQGTPRITFDVDYLNRITQGPHWIACCISNESEDLVAFVFAMERTLYCRGRSLQAYYPTLLTVSSQYRRRGLGQWLLRCLHCFVATERHADIVISAFHPSRAGLPTVKVATEGTPGWDLLPFHTAHLWWRDLDHTPLPLITSAEFATRISLKASEACFTPVSRLGIRTLETPCPVSVFKDTLRTHYQVAFGLEKSLLTRYFSDDTPQAGTFRYHVEPKGQAECLMSYEIVILSDDTGRIGSMGVIQAVHAYCCTPAQLTEALTHLCHIFQQQGCIGVGLLDHDVIPHDVLRHLQFRPTGDSRVFAVRGPRPVVQQFATVQPPYFLDW